MTNSPASPRSHTLAERELRAAVRGTVLTTTDAAYDGARRIWNGAVDRRPAVLTRCADAEDAAMTVRIAREHGLPLSVRGGGHDWSGRALREGGVVLDLSELRGVTVNPSDATATAQGGVRAGDLVAGAHEHGFKPVVGTVKAVGVTGLTLGGGYGLLGGLHGLAADNLLAARVVLADGTEVTADATENPDLYWALRGGGGNFGVVTDLRYRVHPGATVLSGLLLFPLDQASSVLRGYRELIAEAPDELTVMAGFFTGPEGTPVLFLLPMWSGDPALGNDAVARLAKLGTPVFGEVNPMAYQDVLGMFDAVVVDGRHNEMRTRWLPELTDTTTELLIAAAARMTSPYSGLYLHHFHGAAARVPSADTAFALRKDHLLVEIAASWAPAGDTEADAAHGQWARQVSAELAESALSGGYPNLLGSDERERALASFGAGGAERLLEVKRRYDPDNVFSAVPALLPTPS
ncbi:FAD-binding oxidoreductase [Streptomyces luteolus]|uniref:FAD-binding oxidoreductase n=1 Tax=Streptomyces luteolus TaxID=3043615 RepID=A0ABT6SUK3_9ACTN|nr:FAD-binding oxidoreductase [Streptomyces sp. B-S-A12]MDI3418509.1 FAD-binding oxidoreductase [Streptomyces sp. B-S-A12]